MYLSLSYNIYGTTSEELKRTPDDDLGEETGGGTPRLSLHSLLLAAHLEIVT